MLTSHPNTAELGTQSSVSVASTDTGAAGLIALAVTS